jgi:hypothetical protein
LRLGRGGLGRVVGGVVGTDDEDNEKDDDNEKTEELIDTPRLIKICNGKIKRLVRRMIQHFEKAVQEKDGGEKCLVKLLGVLAILRELRVLDSKVESLPLGETFVPMQEREHLLSQSLKYLHGRGYGFLKNINTIDQSANWDEISRLNGLLLWLAHDCGASLFAKRGFNESLEDTQKRIANVSYLLLIAPEAVSDLEALNEATISIEKTTRSYKLFNARQWIKTQVAIGKKLLAIKQKADFYSNKIQSTPLREYWAFIRGEVNPSLHVVLKDGDPVTLTEVGNDNGKKEIKATDVAAFRPLRPFKPSETNSPYEKHF